MADVRGRAGVSTSTVSRALRDMPGVSEAPGAADPADRRRARATSSRPRRRACRAARPAGSPSSCRPIDVWFFSTMLAASRASPARTPTSTCSIYQVDGEAQRKRFFHELPARRKVDAVILIALPVPERRGGPARSAGRPGRRRRRPGARLPARAGRRPRGRPAAVEHLVDLGHRRIAMIRTDDAEGALWSSDADARAGYRDALAAAGSRPRRPRGHRALRALHAAGTRAMRQLLALARAAHGASSPTPTRWPSARCSSSGGPASRSRASVGRRRRRPPDGRAVRPHHGAPARSSARVGSPARGDRRLLQDDSADASASSSRVVDRGRRLRRARPRAAERRRRSDLAPQLAGRSLAVTLTPAIRAIPGPGPPVSRR